MEEFLKLLAAPLGVAFYAALLQLHARRRARRDPANGKNLRQLAYLFGRKLGARFSRKRPIDV